MESISQAVWPGLVVHWFIVESDSTDDSVTELKRLSHEIASFEYSSFGPLQNSIPRRVDRIAFCRQSAKDKLLALHDEFDYVIVADFDGILSPLRAGAISDSVSRLPGATVITANSIGRYYDLFALRKDGWVDSDYRQLEAQLEALGYSRLASKYKSMVSKMIRIRRHQPPIAVASAFGGLAIYKRAAFEKSAYLPSSSDECEHVFLNRRITSNGGSIWIDPQLQVAPELRHTFPAWPIFRPFWWFVLAGDFIRRKLLGRSSHL
ncbi:MAG: hypothetical protein RLZZ249_272 [Actinomycetota bacterium]